jgi:hypothetical protein
MIHIPPSVANQAHDVAGLTAGEVASLVEESAATAMIGIFPTGDPDEPWRGALGDDVSDAATLCFSTSMVGFHARQARRAAQKSGAHARRHTTTGARLQ